MDETSFTTADQALKRLRAPNQQGMGRAQTADFGEVTADTLAGIEAKAVTIRTWNPRVIPGLLQTSRYAWHAIRSTSQALSTEETSLRVQKRMDRQQSFRLRWEMENAGVGRAMFMIGEAAITQPLQEPRDHVYTLAKLLDISRTWPKIDIRVLPEETLPSALASQFSLYHLEGTVGESGGRLPGPRLGYLETLVGGWYTTRMEDIARMHSVFSDLMAAAMTPIEARHFIKGEQDKCWGRTRDQSSSHPATPTPATASQSPEHERSE